jgi:hypothetical protein
MHTSIENTSHSFSASAYSFGDSDDSTGEEMSNHMNQTQLKQQKRNNFKKKSRVAAMRNRRTKGYTVGRVGGPVESDFASPPFRRAIGAALFHSRISNYRSFFAVHRFPALKRTIVQSTEPTVNLRRIANITLFRG